ncbi:oligosaccharide flippase family protein [Chitinophaga sp. SYP-B3965]|uniref:lipopolysaccharide biosynthesis protein n=1 Tax=Chitinophaga sp. SYP-B3965 TaxID=2663120 RepID=UPI0012998F03|nr:polysaccharide biosynthesis C-terminal domain-containing protein [Chitinophaga sp. SYP-B3965]MRG49063.1 oligosaccharide flippase family protein [Chitinophaga sp. SYP-B3965]
MGNIKNLAGQTLWYGLPTITARFLSFFTQILFTGFLIPYDFGQMSLVYQVIPFLNVIFTYGLETSYFRFAQTTDKGRLYNTLSVSMLVSTSLFTFFLIASAGPIAALLKMPNHADFIYYTSIIIFLDTLTTLPFARIRQEGRPKKYAFIKLMNVVSILVFSMLFLVACPALKKSHPGLMSWFDPNYGVGYILIANLLGSLLTMILLTTEIKAIRWHFDGTLWKEIMRYSLPLVIVGFGGMINELMSRLSFTYLLPGAQFDVQGIFSANYKLALLIVIFIQAFKMAAEPFFFNLSKNEDARLTYARIMKFFVIVCGAVFLGVALFLDIWKILITTKNASYADALDIVPIITMGTVFLGIYYNLTIWYKLTNQNMIGAYITIAGAVITILLNIWLIPRFVYMGAAWTTFICYAFMMVASYLFGQKYYPVPYAVGKLLSYLGLATVIYLVHHYIRSIHPGIWTVHAAGVLGVGIYGGVILFMERAEFGNLLSRLRKAG